jgi:hypothetical protein
MKRETATRRRAAAATIAARSRRETRQARGCNVRLDMPKRYVHVSPGATPQISFDKQLTNVETRRILTIAGASRLLRGGVETMTMTKIGHPHERDDILGLLADCHEFCRLNADLGAACARYRKSHNGWLEGDDLLAYDRELARLNRRASDAACR